VPLPDDDVEIGKIICSTDVIVKIVRKRRSADRRVTLRLPASRHSPTASISVAGGCDSGLQFGFVRVECLTDEFKCSRQIFFEGGPDLARRKDESTFALAAGA
jgi:hypothetical protein